jgi:hypothetical protein
LGLSTKIEHDHRIATNQLGIRLQNEDEFKTYDKAIVYPEGSERTSITLSEVLFFRNLGQRFTRLEPLLRYVYRDAFWEHHFGSHIRHLIGNLKSAAGEFDPAKPEHLALLSDVAAVFSIALAQCAAEVFRQCLQPSSKDSLSELLKMLVWGGREQYEFSETLRKRVFELQGGKEEPGLEPWALPEWNHFIQLIRNLLDRPTSAFELPWILRRFALDLARGWEPLKYARVHDLLAVKYAMLTIAYLCKACRLPDEFEKDLISKLVSVQSRIVERRDNSGDMRANHQQTKKQETDPVVEQESKSRSSGPSEGLTLFTQEGSESKK